MTASRDWSASPDAQRRPLADTPAAPRPLRGQAAAPRPRTCAPTRRRRPARGTRRRPAAPSAAPVNVRTQLFSIASRVRIFSWSSAAPSAAPASNLGDAAAPRPCAQQARPPHRRRRGGRSRLVQGVLCVTSQAPNLAAAPAGADADWLAHIRFMHGTNKRRAPFEFWWQRPGTLELRGGHRAISALRHPSAGRVRPLGFELTSDQLQAMT